MNLLTIQNNEYQMMLNFFQNGGTVDNMPPELLRVRRIWKRADELFRKYPYYANEKLANQLISDLPEYDLALSTAKKHITYAKKYFDFVETESPETHRRVLTTIAYKQIAILEELQLKQPQKAAHISKMMENWSNRISSINHLYDENKETEQQHGDITIIISDNELDFPDLPKISDKELYTIIEDMTDVVDITTAEKQKLIDKDVKGKIV
ncbi:MAG: hypothetical protein J7K53_11310 [Bacteroidales bacterium]|nr:hypothetical protein [Bacteroidales bacterium]